jgi:hypothetical protein
MALKKQSNLSNIKLKFSNFGKNIYQNIAGFPWISSILAVGAVLRVSGFVTGSIYYDELFSLQITHQGLFEMISSLRPNLSPPGFEVLLWVVTRIFGWNTFSLRLPSVLAGILSLWLVYKLSGLLQFTQSQKITVLLILALLPYQLLTAQEGRVYSIFIFLFLAGFYAAVSGKWVYLGIALFGMLWGHYVSFFFIPGLLLIAILVRPRVWKKIMLTAVLAGITFIPWLPIFLNRAIIPIPWFTPLTLEYFILASYNSFFGFAIPPLITSIIYSWIVILLTILVCIYIVKLVVTKPHFKLIAFSNLVLYLGQNDLGREGLHDSGKIITRILFISFMMPLILLFLVSIHFQNILIYRTISLLIPTFILWLVHLVVIQNPSIFHKLIWLASIGIISSSVIYWIPSSSASGMKELSAIVKANFQSGDAFYHDTGFTVVIFKYYFPDRPQYLIDGNDTIGKSDLQLTKTNIQELAPNQVPAQRLWVVWSRSEDSAIINKIADNRIKALVANCPLMGVLNYPTSWDAEVYLCMSH